MTLEAIVRRLRSMISLLVLGGLLLAPAGGLPATAAPPAEKEPPPGLTEADWEQLQI